MQKLPSLTRLFGALSITAALAGCVTAPKPIDPAAAAKIKRADVISVAGGEFNRLYVGFTVFNNDKETTSIADWGLDKAYEQQISEVIKAGRDITVTRSPYKRELFAKANEVNHPLQGGGHKWQAIEPAARDHCATHSLDALFVLIRSWSGDIFGGTNQAFNGVGMYTRGIGTPNTYLHVVTELAMLDCKTGQPLETRRVAMKQEGMPADISRSIPYLRIAFDEPKRPASTWTDTEREDIRKAMLQLPRDTWPVVINSILPRRGSDR